MITVAEATTAKTATVAEQEILADLEAAGVDAAGFSPFSVTSALPGVHAKAIAHQSAIRADVARASFLELLLATPGADAWVEKVCRAWYQVDRLPATKAQWLFRVSASSAVGSVVRPPRSLVAEAGGVLFENIAELQISGGQRVLVLFEARAAGTSGNVLPGAVTGFRVAPAGLSVTNATPGRLLYAGRAAETNTGLVARGRARFAAKSYGGARSAYLVWVAEAFEAAGMTSTITKIGVDDENPNGPGSTDLYLANAAGPATVDELALVDAFLQPRRGLGTGPLRVLAAPAKTIAIAGTLFSSSPSSLVEADIKWVELAADLPLGGGPKGILYLDSIRGAVLGPDGVPGVYKFNVLAPTGDTKLSTFDVVTFDTSAVSLQVG